MRRSLLPALISAVLAGCIIDLDDGKRNPPPSEVSVGGLLWRAKAETYWSAPQRVHVKVVGNNPTDTTVTVYWGGDAAHFNVFRSETDEDRIYSTRDENRGRLDIGYSKAVAPGDSVVLMTNADVPDITGEGIAGTYFLTAQVELAGLGENPPPFEPVRIPELSAGDVLLDGAVQPLPAVRVHNDIETTSTSAVVGDSLRVRVTYRNVGATNRRIHRSTVCTYLTVVIADQEVRDRLYRYKQSGPVYDPTEAAPGMHNLLPERCDDPPFIDLAAGEARTLEQVSSMAGLLARNAGARYYLAVTLLEPEDRMQSAGAVQLR